MSDKHIDIDDGRGESNREQIAEDEKEVEGFDEPATTTVERVDRGFSIEATIARGDGPDNRDRLTLKAKGGDLSEAAEEMDEAIATHLPRWGAQFREHQPTESGDDDA